MIFRKKEKNVEPKDYEIKKLKGEILLNRIKGLILFVFIGFEIVLIGHIMQQKGMLDAFDLGPKVAIINIDKPITTKYINDVMKKVDDALEEKSYLEYILVLNSPGGSPSASKEFAEYIKELQKKKPVTVYVQGMAASGGYYIASVGKPLYANKNAIVGSIGVIMSHYYIGEAAKKLGVEEDNVEVGEFKKPVSLFKRVSEKDREYLLDQVMLPLYNNFKEDVAANRGLTVKELEPFTEGKIYTGGDPRIRGILVDKVATLSDIKEMIRKKYPRFGKKFHFYEITKDDAGSLFGSMSLNLKLDASKAVEQIKGGLQ